MHMCAERSGFSFSKCRTVIARKSVKSLRTNEFPYCRLFNITAVSGGGAAWRSAAIEQKQDAHRKRARQIRKWRQ